MYIFNHKAYLNQSKSDIILINWNTVYSIDFLFFTNDWFLISYLYIIFVISHYFLYIHHIFLLN